MRLLILTALVLFSLVSQAQVRFIPDTTAGYRPRLAAEIGLAPQPDGSFYWLRKGQPASRPVIDLANVRGWTSQATAYASQFVSLGNSLTSLSGAVAGLTTAQSSLTLQVGTIFTRLDGAESSVSAALATANAANAAIESIQDSLPNFLRRSELAEFIFEGADSAGTYPRNQIDLLLDQREPLIPVGATTDYVAGNKTLRDLKTDVGKFASSSAIASYTGSLLSARVDNLGEFRYDAASSAAIDNVVVLPATGKGSGRWVAVELSRRNVLDWGIITGTGVSQSVATANRNAFQAAVNSRLPLFLPAGANIVLFGLVSASGIPVNIVGSTISANIYQMKPATGVFDFDVDHESCVLENINLKPLINQVGAYAVKVSGAGGNNPNVQIKNVVINHGGDSSGVTRVFEGGGFWLINFGEGLLEHCKYFGRNKSIGNGLLHTNTVVSVSSTIRDFKVYGAKRGIYSISTGTPGIEGTRVVDSDLVDTDYGIEAKSDGVYGVYYPPQYDIINCHFNSFTRAIKIRRFAQFKIIAPLAYLFNDMSIGSNGIDIDSSAEASVISPYIYKVGIGAVNGIVLGSNAQDIKITGAYTRMQTGDALIVINSGATRIRAYDNDANGTSFCVADASGTAEYWGNFKNGVPEPSSLIKTFTTAVVGSGGVPLAAGAEIYASLPDTFTGISAGDGVDFARVGGLGSMPPEIMISFQCVEAGKVRIHIRNTAATGKTFVESTFTLKITRH